MGFEARVPDREEICAHMRQVLRPSIVGLSPKDLHVKPLLFGCNSVSYHTEREDYITTPASERRKRPLPCVRRMKPGSSEMESPRSPISHMQIKRLRSGQGLFIFLSFPF